MAISRERRERQLDSIEMSCMSVIDQLVHRGHSDRKQDVFDLAEELGRFTLPHENIRDKASLGPNPHLKSSIPNPSMAPSGMTG